MAVNKRKVLDAARKYAQKGAKEKALKEYHTLLKLDPRDAKLHLEIGDCYRRWGQIDEAVTQYARVADQYKDDGFDARSVAVFKQILNLDPKRYSAYVSLSELYQRMGLDSEALSALQAAADGHHKEGNKREALELLRKMATLDPTNTTSRLKVAELLRQEGMEEDAISEYEAVLKELERQGATESILAVQERILELQPNRVDILVSIGRRLIEFGKVERAEPFAKRALEKDPQESEAYEVLIEVYKRLGNEQNLATTTRALAKIYRDRGDEDRARELAQRVPLQLELDQGAAAAPVEVSESSFLSDDELLDEDFLAGDVSETSDPAEELALDGGDELMLEEDDADELDLSGPEIEPEPAPAPSGDPDQLLAEASVYLRYGKRDQAIASLEAILGQEPEHRGALEKLGEAYAEGGDADEAVSAWSRAAVQARAEGDEDGFSVLRDRIAGLDDAAARALDDSASGSALDDEPASGSDDALADIDFEIDAPEEPAADDGFEIDVSVGDDEAEADDDEGLEPGLDDDAIEFEDAAPDDEVSRAEDTQPDEDEGIDVDVDVEVDFDDAEEDESESADVDEVEEPEEEAADAAPSSSNSTSQQVEEDLEEADFYFQQGLHDEAEAIYRRVLKVAPKHPSALLRMGEIAAARGQDPSGAGPAPVPAAQADDASEPTLDIDAGDDLDVDFDLDSDSGGPSPGEDSTEVAELSLSSDDDDGPALALDLPPAPAEVAAAKPRSRADVTLPFEQPQPKPKAAAKPQSKGKPQPKPQPKPAPSKAVAPEPLAAAGGGDDGGFDLAAELRDVLEEAESSRGDDGVLSTVEDGFESIFADFKQGVSATLHEDDFDTRYDLGIAYREMELYEDAIGEFRYCLASPARKLEALHLMGLCALDLGRAQDATNHLEQALSTPDLPDEQLAGLRFDLGRALEAMGDVARARSAYEAARASDPGFPGVEERLAGLGRGGAKAVVQDDASEGFEDFDDLVAEADDDDDATEQTESFESFDDVITEAEAAVDEAPDEVVEDEPIADALIEEEPEPAGPSRKGKSKKKISFV